MAAGMRRRIAGYVYGECYTTTTIKKTTTTTTTSTSTTTATKLVTNSVRSQVGDLVI